MDDSLKMSKEWKTQHSMISSDGTVKYDFMMSLQNIALAKIISSLLMNEKILNGIADTWKYIIRQAEREVIEENIVANLSHLFLPNSVFQKITDVVKDLRKSLFDWIDYHNDNIFCCYDPKYSAVNLINNVTWTARGRIDYQRTAKSIFANQNIFLDDKTKYKLACNYCLEDEIELLAPSVLEMFEPLDGDVEPMVYFWIKHIKGELNISRNPRHNNMSDDEYVMQTLLRSCGTCNDIPIRFMWNRLSEEEKERNITLLVENIENKDYLFSVLSNISYDLQQKVFKKCPRRVLACTLNDWLWGEYFLLTTFTVLQSLEFDNPLEYWRVLSKVCTISKDEKNCMHDEYKSFFKRLWQETSTECKDSIIQFNGSGSIEWFLAYILSWERDTDIAEVILEDLTTVQKRNVAFGKYGVRCCINFILKDRWDVLELFLKHTLSTQEDLSSLKKKLLEDGKLRFKLHFQRCESFDKVKHFSKWAFETKYERLKYRNKFRSVCFF